jgi:hypothetical protein
MYTQGAAAPRQFGATAVTFWIATVSAAVLCTVTVEAGKFSLVEPVTYAWK